jgi:hypothetical protein
MALQKHSCHQGQSNTEYSGHASSLDFIDIETLAHVKANVP